MAKICSCVVESMKSERKRRRRDHISVESGSSDDEICCAQKQKKNRNEYRAAEPVIRCVWSGDFDVRHDESIYHRRVYSLNAFVSSNACQRARDASSCLEGVIYLEMVPTPSLWPNSFRRKGGPTDEDIALYFFPPLPLHQSLYDALVFEMWGDDLAMRASVHKGEILIFPSTQLPPCSRRFQGKFYLWGVFRDAQNSTI